MARNFRVYVTKADSEFSPVSFETVESAPVPTNVLPHITSLRMDVSRLDSQQKRLLCNALREAADFIEWGTREYAQRFRSHPERESRLVRGWRVGRCPLAVPEHS